MYARNEIYIIVWIMNKYHIRTMLSKVKRVVPRYRNMRRVLTALIMQLTKTAVWVFVEIWYRNDIRVTIFILLSCLPYAFKAIPHACFVWQEHGLSFDTYVVFQAVFHPD